MSSKGNSAMMAVALFVTATALILSAGCFGGPHHQSTDCTIDVNVVVDNNQADQHVFTYLVELVQVKDQTCSCPQGYTLVEGTCTKTTYGTCQNCPYVEPVYGPWGGFENGKCPGGQGSNTCQQSYVEPVYGSWGSQHNGDCDHDDEEDGVCEDYCVVGNGDGCGSGFKEVHHHRTVITPGYWHHNHRTYTAGHYDCGGEGFVACSPVQNNKQRAVTILTAAQTCTCPNGYIKSGDTCEKVVDSEQVTSQQSNPATVTLTYQNDGFWYGWRWHLRWHDRFGVLHDRCFGELDQDSDYVIRVSDVNLDTGYGQPQSQTHDTDICGGDVTFQYTGPFCPDVPCSEGSYCAGGPVNPVCVPNVCDGQHPCPEGYQCVGNQCVPVPCDALHPCPPGSHCEAGVCVPDVTPPGDGGPPGGFDIGGPACPGLVQYTRYFVPYCDYRWPDVAPSLVNFTDTVLCPTDRISAIFDFGEGYSDVDACLVDVYNGMGTPENVSVCELRLRTYTEPDPDSMRPVRVEHLYANPGTYHVVLSAAWSSAPAQVITQDNTVTIKPSLGECTVLGPGDTYHKPYQILIR